MVEGKLPNVLSAREKHTTAELYGHQAALGILLFKLDLVGTRVLTYTAASVMISGHPHVPPPWSIQHAVVSLCLSYTQFCPKRLADKL